MAGHSQFKNIMHRKGAKDAKRAKIFTKLAREITVAAKLGMPDPAHNPRLRAAIIAAKSESMPKDNIERAINKAVGGDTENFEQTRYEGYGPGKVAVIVEALPDNRHRTAAEMRALFNKNGGNMGEANSVAFNFQRIGLIHYPASAGGEYEIMEAAINAGADDVSSGEKGNDIYCGPDELHAVQKKLEEGIKSIHLDKSVSTEVIDNKVVV